MDALGKPLTERQRQVILALYEVGATGVERGGSNGETVYALTRDKGQEHRLPDANYGSALNALAQRGLAEPHPPFRSTGGPELWRLTAAGCELAGTLDREIAERRRFQVPRRPRLSSLAASRQLARTTHEGLASDRASDLER